MRETSIYFPAVNIPENSREVLIQKELRDTCCVPITYNHTALAQAHLALIEESVVE